MSSPWGDALTRLRHDRAGVAAGAVLAGVAVFSAMAPLIGVDGTAVDLDRALLPVWSTGHLLGTDELGRDVLVRLMQGGQVSLVVALAVALGAAVFGTAWGVCSAYAGGIVDVILMRWVDALLSIPVLPLLMLLAAMPGGRGGDGASGAARVALLLCALGWMGVARLARAATLQARAYDHVLAARALGASRTRVVLVHLLPHALPPVVVAATMEVGAVILYEAALSFLGLGIRPPLPSWGNMLTHAQDYVWRAPLLAVWPGVLIFAAVVSVNVLGDAFRRALDPRATPGTDDAR